MVSERVIAGPRLDESRRIRRFSLGLGLCLALAIAPASALGEEKDAGRRAAARELALSGAEAFDKQEFPTALDRFQRAESLMNVPSITVMTARCLARLGRLLEAVDKYEETRRAHLSPNAPEAFRRAVAEAGVEIERERERLARLELHLPAGNTEGLEVRLDGNRLPEAMLGVPMPIDPGQHHVSAISSSHRPFERDITLGESSRLTLDIELKERHSNVSLAATSSGSEASANQNSGSPVLAYSLLGVGVVGLAAGAATGVVALSRKSDLDRACDPGCPQGMSSELDSFRANRTLSYIGLGVGVVAAGVGGYLLFRHHSAHGDLSAQLWPDRVLVGGSF